MVKYDLIFKVMKIVLQKWLCNAVSGEYVRLCFATEKTDNEGTTWSRETNGGES